MKAVIAPSSLSGSFEAMPSKSHVHRLLICSALADKKTTIATTSTSRDIETTAACLQALGAGIKTGREGIVVTPIGKGGAPAKGGEKPLIACGESGSTLRFLLPVSATVCDGARFTGEGRLPERPIDDLLAAMVARGVSFSQRSLPFETSGRLVSGTFSFPGNISSQYVTGLLLALTKVTGTSTISLTTPLESASYVRMTLEALASFGVKVDAHASQWRVSGGQTYVSPGVIRPVADWSNAAPFLAAGALGGRHGDEGGVTAWGLSLGSCQGDRMIVDLLERFGADVSITRKAGKDGSDRVSVAPGRLVGCEIDVSDCPDLLPVLAIVACGAVGRTRIYNAERLRLKESDRLATTAALIDALGGEVEELDDGLEIMGSGEKLPLEGGVVDDADDHRIAMAAALAATLCKRPVTIGRAEAVGKSYPLFFDDFKALGGQAKLSEEGKDA